jgi:hypothetical protein
MKDDDGTDLANSGLDWPKVIELMNTTVFAIRDDEIVRPPFRKAASDALAAKKGGAR